MPAASPDQWQLLRLEWEQTPEMTYTEVANRLGVSVVAVSKRSRRELWTKVAELDKVLLTPLAAAEAAIARLVKIVQTSKDDAAAVKAAAIILDRTMGRVTAEQKEPLVKTPEQETALEFPDWAKAPGRLGYKHASASDPLMSPALPSVAPIAGLTPSDEPPASMRPAGVFESR